MYRAPSSSGGGSGTLLPILLLFGAFYLAGCDVPTDPSGSGLALESALDIADETDASLAIAADPVLTGMVVADVAAELGSSPSPTVEAAMDDARGAFDDAADSYRSGDRAGARSHGRRGRAALARVLAERGEEVIVEWIERLEAVRDVLADQADDHDRPQELREELDRLIGLARDALAEGDLQAAAEHVVEARLRVDHSRHRRHDRRPQGDRAHHARLHVARAHVAVDLAGRLLDGIDATDRQIQLLEHAARSARQARHAYEHGAPAAAVVHAQKAVGTALAAYLHPEVTVEKVEAVKIAAQELVDAAVAALGVDGDSFASHVLRRVVMVFENGLSQLESGNLRGVHPLWQAGVTAGALLPAL